MEWRNPLDRLSQGEQLIVVTYGVALLSGALIGLFLLYDTLSERHEVGLYRAWLAMSGAIGATSSLFLVRQSFGKSGLWGWVEAAFSGLFATLLTGIIGGTIALPIYGTMFGPWLIVVSFVQMPLLCVPWVLAIAGFHFAFHQYREERESIFKWTPPNRKTALR